MALGQGGGKAIGIPEMLPAAFETGEGALMSACRTCYTSCERKSQSNSMTEKSEGHKPHHELLGQKKAETVRFKLGGDRIVMAVVIQSTRRV